MWFNTIPVGTTDMTWGDRMSGRYGLKDYLHYHLGESLKQYFTTLYWQIRYAWQRAWRGYDDTDVFELAYNFTSRMPVLLREFKKHNDTLFCDFDHGEKTDLTKEQTDAVLDEMIFYFENCEFITVYERLGGEQKLNESERINEVKAAVEEHSRCWNMAMMLFSKWSNSLWY